MQEIELINVDSEVEHDKEWLKEIVKDSQVDLSEEIERPDTIISIGSHEYNGKTFPTDVMTAGEFSVISAPSKTKKSFLKSAFVAAFIGGESINYFDNFRGHRKDDNETIIDIDTEQSAYYSQRTFRNSIKMVGGMYENYIPFKLRRLTAPKRVEFIDAYLRENRFKKNIRLMFIDGIADLVQDSNDLVMSNAIVEKIMQWTDIYKMHICVIIHNAYGQKKPTGHLGSSITKKAETVMFLSKSEHDPRITEVECGYSRGVDFEPFSFMIKNGLPMKLNNGMEFSDPEFTDENTEFGTPF